MEAAAPAEDEDDKEAGMWCVADDVEREREGGASAFLTPAGAFDLDPAGSGPADVVSNAVFVAAPFMAAPPLNNQYGASKSTHKWVPPIITFFFFFLAPTQID